MNREVICKTLHQTGRELLTTELGTIQLLLKGPSLTQRQSVNCAHVVLRMAISSPPLILPATA